MVATVKRTGNPLSSTFTPSMIRNIVSQRLTSPHNISFNILMESKEIYPLLHNWRWLLANYHPLKCPPQMHVQCNAATCKELRNELSQLKIVDHLSWRFQHGHISVRWLSASSLASLSSVHKENHGFSYAKLWFQFRSDFQKKITISIPILKIITEKE